MLAAGGAIVCVPEQWAFEPKFDGWRVLVYCDEGQLLVRTPSGRT
jgi:ATP-dependent DNA ligase